MALDLTGRLTRWRHAHWGCPTASPTLQQAQELSRGGRFAEAIELLSRAYEADGEAALACHLLRLRCAAARQAGTAHPDDPWPPPVSRRLHRDGALPVLTAHELSVETLASGILHNGGLIVRGLFPPAHVERLRSCIRSAFDARDRFAAGNSRAADTAWYHRFDVGPRHATVDDDRRFVEEAGGVLGADSPASLHTVLRLAEEQGIVAMVEQFLQQRPAVSAMKTTLRIVPPTTSTGWHQDGAFLGSYIRSVNMWIALSECGEDAPSLDLIPKRFDQILPTGVDGATFPWSVSESTAQRVADEAGVPIEHAHFEPGDVFFFDHMNLHRTGVRPGMTKERWAIEWWFFAPSHFPQQHPPILA